MSILLDAGPCLNFLAVGQQNVLVQLASTSNVRLKTAERVDREILGKCRDPRFARTGAQATWLKLRDAGRVEVLNDDLASRAFESAVSRISGMPAATRVRSSESLGEILVLAHASLFAQQGTSVVVLIDESDGRRRALRERRWLEQHNATGLLRLLSTRQVLERAALQAPAWIANGHSWQQVYRQMRKFDDGLAPLD